MPSQAWAQFLVHLREATALLRADPASTYAKRRAAATGQDPPAASVELTNALNKGCALLLSGRLQGCVQAQMEEFLERIDSSGVVVDSIPTEVRAALSSTFHDGENRKKRRLRPTLEQTAEVHAKYAVLWTSGSVLPAGTLKTDSFADEGNPWPSHVQGLLRRCGADPLTLLEATKGKQYRENLESYVGELIDFRNSVAHGEEPNGTWSAGDVRLHMQWVTRMARACDAALEQQLLTITGNGW